jgi:hypothetical protein
MVPKASARCRCCPWPRRLLEMREALVSDLPKLAAARGRITRWDVAYSLNMGVACLVTYWIITVLLAPVVDSASDFLGGMWAVVAVVFVFRDTNDEALRAGLIPFCPRMDRRNPARYSSRLALSSIASVRRLLPLSKVVASQGCSLAMSHNTYGMAGCRSSSKARKTPAYPSIFFCRTAAYRCPKFVLSSILSCHA